MTQEQMRYFLEDENLRKLARQIMVSRNAEQILAALLVLLPEKEVRAK